MTKRKADASPAEDIISKKSKRNIAADEDDIALVAVPTQNDTPNIVALTDAQSTNAALPEDEHVADVQDSIVAGPEDGTPAAPENTAVVATGKESKKSVTPKKTTTPKKATTLKRATTPKNSTTPKKTATKKPPIAELFDLYQREVPVPPPNPFWGVKPVTGSARPDPIQPSARESNGQTNPPMWEDRGSRFKRGSRFVKYFGSIAPENVDELEADLDQEDLLITHLMDMRPIS